MKRARKKIIIKKSQSSTDSAQTDFSIYSSINSGNYIYKGYGDNDSIRVSSAGSHSVYSGQSSPTFTIHREQVKDLLRKIKSKTNVRVDKLDPEHAAIYERLNEIVRLTHGTEQIHSHLLQDIKNVFPPTDNVIPMTVGAYFNGCFVSDNFKGGMGCNPKCAGNIPSNDPSYSECEDSVIHYSNGTLTYQHQKGTSHAYVYIGDDHFEGFSKQNIDVLKRGHIFKVSLVRAKPGDMVDNMDVEDPVPVDKLPLKGTTAAQPVPPHQAQNGWFWILIAVVIILALIVLGYMFFK